jgi:translation initiation factor IF-2
MSKKDLLERLSRVPTPEVRPTRRPDELDRVAADQVTTRVSTNVVRRRKQPGEAADVAPVVVRRRTIDLGAPAPVRTFEPEPEPVEARPRSVAPHAEPPPQEVAAPAPVGEAPEPVAPVHPPPTPTRPPGRARQSAANSPPNATADEPAPAAQEPAPPAPPEQVAAPVEKPAPSPSPVPVGRTAEPDRERTAPPRPHLETQDTPRYAGLGKAVVMPPPGYDPTNPSAWRREQAPRPVGSGRPTQVPQPTPAEAANRGRRRVESTGDDGRGRGRRSPSVPGRAQIDAPGRFGAKRKVVSGRGAPKQASPGPKAQKRKVRIDNVISVGQLAHELGVKAAVVIRHLMDLGKMAGITEMLDMDTAAMVAAEFDYEVENVGFQEGNYLPTVEKQEEEVGLARRAPVVAVMGHVDHGKTTLLDAIRSSRVASGEAGGITQHIGAYQVEKNGQPITFLDTPGHEAFSAMRARGASVTDVVVLVVAADDGVQPQTEEALAHARAAGVPIVVAINKIDKPGVNPDVIKQRLADKDLVPEDWGGDTMFVPVSALRQTGIDELLEAILLQAEVLDLKANPERHAEGIVIEAKMERGRGPVATVLVQRGTLHRGDFVVLGSAFGKVRAVVDHTGARLKDAPPSTPVELFGLSELPEVGDKMMVVENEKNARALAEHRAQERRDQIQATTRRRTAEDLFASASEEVRERVLVVLKADVQGSLEALKGALAQLNVEGTEVRVLHAMVGDISESDVNLAAANGALLLGFNVGVDARARQAATEQGIEPEFYAVIYDLLNRVERQLKGLLAPVFESVKQGSVEVRALFKISKVGTVAGSYVLDGKVGRNHSVKVLRNGDQVWEGKISTLKRFKDDVREVSAGYECGIALEGFADLQVGDILESYSQEQVTS